MLTPVTPKYPQVSMGKGKGGRGGGKLDQSALLMASLFGEGDKDEDKPRR